MLGIERQKKILDFLKEINPITIQKLSQLLNVSSNTIRADVAILEKSGVIIKVHGAISLPTSNINARKNEIGIRYEKNINEKLIISKEAIKYLPVDKDFSMFIDSSTSALEMANLLSKINIRCTIITHFTNIANILSNIKNISIIFCGGTWWGYENCTIGIETVSQLEKYKTDIAIIGCTSIEIENGIFNGNIETVPIKQKMIENATETWLLCDSSKFDFSSLLKIANFKDIDRLFTDKEPSENWKSHLSEMNVELYFPHQ